MAVAFALGIIALTGAGVANAALPSSDGPYGWFAGNVTTAPPVAEGTVVGLASQVDGGVVGVVTGSAVVATDIQVVRYRRDGSLDAGFGTGGLARVPVPGTLTTSGAVTVDAQGRIVVAGAHDTGVATVLHVARLLPDGTPDVTFGSGGVVDLPGCGTALTHVATRADGSIVAAGSSVFPCSAGPEFVAFAVRADGSIDTQFGGAGRVAGVAPGLAQATLGGLALDAAGRVVLAGDDGSAAPSDRIFALRLDAAGQPDATFGSGGVVEAAGAQVADVLLGADGSVSVAATSSADGSFVRRYDTNGLPVAAYGSGGASASAHPGGGDVGFRSGHADAAMHRDGSITVCDYLAYTVGGMPADGVRVTRFAPDGRIVLARDTPSAADLRVVDSCTVSRDGVVVYGGTEYDAFTGDATPVLDAEYVRDDFEAPLVAVATVPAGADETYVVTASDAATGLEDVTGAYSFDGGPWQAAASATLPALKHTDAARTVRVRDRAGTIGTARIDPPPPPPPVLRIVGSATSGYDSATISAAVAEAVEAPGPYGWSFDGGATWQAAPVLLVGGLQPDTPVSVRVVARAANGVQSAPAQVSVRTRDNGAPTLLVATVAGGGGTVRAGAATFVRSGSLRVTSGSSFGATKVRASFRGAVVLVRAGRIDLGRLPEGRGVLVVTATDVDGDVVTRRLTLVVDRTAPTLRAGSRFVLGPIATLRVADAVSGARISAVRVKLPAKLGRQLVRVRIADRAGNSAVRAVLVQRRLSLADQTHNRGLVLRSRSGERVVVSAATAAASFRYLDDAAPWYTDDDVQHEYVREVQWRLVQLGCLRAGTAADGRLDLPTIRAVQAYQRARGLPVLGTVGVRTRAALDAALRRGLPRTCR